MLCYSLAEAWRTPADYTWAVAQSSSQPACKLSYAQTFIALKLQLSFCQDS